MLGKKTQIHQLYLKQNRANLFVFLLYIFLNFNNTIFSLWFFIPVFFRFSVKKNIHSFSPPRFSTVHYSTTNESLNHILCHQRQGTPTGQSRYRADVWLIILLILGESHSIISQKCLYCKLCVLGCLCCHLKISLFPQTLLKYLFH